MPTDRPGTDHPSPDQPSPDQPGPDHPSPRVQIVARTGSTNADLRELAAADQCAWPHLSVLLAREQTSGKGRTGRTWDSAGVQSLTFSIVLRPRLQRQRWGWLPLLAGLATVRAVRLHTGASDRVGVKWPNDVVDRAGGTTAVPGWGRMRKLGGILTEVLPDGAGAVVGIGLNLAGANLPVPWAGTVQQVQQPGAGECAGQMPPGGADLDPWGAGRAEELMRQIVAHLDRVLTQMEQGTSVRSQVQQECVTIGAQVQVRTPDGAMVAGTAVTLADDGALVVRTTTGDHTIRAGDIHHIRTPDGP